MAAAAGVLGVSIVAYKYKSKAKSRRKEKKRKVKTGKEDLGGLSRHDEKTDDERVWETNPMANVTGTGASAAAAQIESNLKKSSGSDEVAKVLFGRHGSSDLYDSQDDAVEWEVDNPMLMQSSSKRISASASASDSAPVLTPELLFGKKGKEKDDNQDNNEGNMLWSDNPAAATKKRPSPQKKGLMQKLRRLSAAFSKSPKKKRREDIIAKRIEISSPSRRALGYHLLDRHAVVLVNTIWEAANAHSGSRLRDALTKVCNAATLVQQGTRHSGRYETDNARDGTITRDSAHSVQECIIGLANAADKLESKSAGTAPQVVSTIAATSGDLVSFAVGYLLCAECARIRIQACGIGKSSGRAVAEAANQLEVATCERVRLASREIAALPKR